MILVVVKKKIGMLAQFQFVSYIAVRLCKLLSL